MSELQILTRTDELANEIRSLAKRTVEGVVEIGIRLIEARGILKKEGRWIEWLEEEFGWKVQTAYNFITAAQAVEKEPRLIHIQSPSILYLLSGAPDVTLEALVEFEGSYLEAKQMIDAEKWGGKIDAMIAALQAVDLKEAHAQGNDEVIHLATTTASRILAEMDAGMQGETREKAVELYREHGDWLSEITTTDPIENMTNAGATLRERQGEPATGKVAHKLYEERHRARLVAWCPDPHEIAIFPRTRNAQADAWRAACIEACMEVVNGGKATDSTVPGADGAPAA